MKWTCTQAERQIYIWHHMHIIIIFILMSRYSSFIIFLRFLFTEPPFILFIIIWFNFWLFSFQICIIFHIINIFLKIQYRIIPSILPLRQSTPLCHLQVMTPILFIVLPSIQLLWHLTLPITILPPTSDTPTLPHYTCMFKPNTNHLTPTIVSSDFFRQFRLSLVIITPT